MHRFHTSSAEQYRFVMARGPTSKENFLPTPHPDVVQVDLEPVIPFVDVAPSATFIHYNYTPTKAGEDTKNS